MSRPEFQFSSPPPWPYRLAVRLASPLLLAHALLRSARDGGRRYVIERLGLGQSPPRNCRWIHAASVGEVLTVLPLIEAVQSLEPDRPILVTTTTPTGAAVLQQRAAPTVHHRYLPIDWPGACRRFMQRVQPESAWIVETEIWPWLYACCQARALGPFIVNARLSPRTMKAAGGWLGSSYQRALADATVLARSAADAQRYVILGARPEQVSAVGNLKFAGHAGTPGADESAAPPFDLSCCVAASTHDDEERQLAEQWLRQPHGLLVIVPRHPARGGKLHAELQTACRLAGAPACARRSRNELPTADARLYLADTLGELQAWFSLASAVFVGGSLVPRGGHNLFEPARQGCAIITGPHTENFTDVVELLEARDALWRADDAARAVAQLRQLTDQPAQARALGLRARAVVERQAGIVDDYLQRLLPAHATADD